ncbi:hypothetical protein M8494_31240 [Serratia ureilytica]
MRIASRRLSCLAADAARNRRVCGRRRRIGQRKVTPPDAVMVNRDERATGIRLCLVPLRWTS